MSPGFTAAEMLAVAYAMMWQMWEAYYLQNPGCFDCTPVAMAYSYLRSI